MLPYSLTMIHLLPTQFVINKYMLINCSHLLPVLTKSSTCATTKHEEGNLNVVSSISYLSSSVRYRTSHIITVYTKQHCKCQTLLTQSTYKSISFIISKNEYTEDNEGHELAYLKKIVYYAG